jgi:ribulose-5-phosphate 4-epimerase/fuculose-1-phosphate aldolase
MRFEHRSPPDARPFVNTDDLRHDVALANRIVERCGLSNVFGHASARIPGTDTFLLPSRRSPAFAEATDLLVLDCDGTVRSGTGTPNSELWIHARIYASRPEVGGIVHAHPHACICLSQIGQPFRIVHNQGGAFAAGVAAFDEIGLIRSRESGDRLALAMGDLTAVIMRGHGITTAAADVRAATVAGLFLEEGAKLQLQMLAAAGGNSTAIRAYSREEADRLSDQLSPGIVARAWEYFAAVASVRPIGG